MTSTKTDQNNAAAQELMAKLAACARVPSLITARVLADAVDAITGAAYATAPDDVARYADRDDARPAFEMFRRMRSDPSEASHKALVIALASPVETIESRVLHNLATLMPTDERRRLGEALERSYQALHPDAAPASQLRRPHPTRRPSPLRTGRALP